MSEPHKPYIPAGKILPETSFKGFILGALLSSKRVAVNAFPGLFCLKIG